MKRGAIPPVDLFQQWKKQQQEYAERNQETITEENMNTAREYIAKNIGREIHWSETELGTPSSEDSTAQRLLLKEFASIGYQVWLVLAEGSFIVPDFVFDWKELYAATQTNDSFTITLPEKSEV